METASPEAAAFIGTQRVARLATAEPGGQPHVVPVCFVYDGARFYSAIDRKPKQTTPLGLKRVRNILANGKVALILDQYTERWQELAYLMVQGRPGSSRRGLSVSGPSLCCVPNTTSTERWP